VKHAQRTVAVTFAAFVVLSQGACASSVGQGDSSASSPEDLEANARGFKKPRGTVAVNFTVDDCANQVYAQGDLVWMGSMKFDETTRMLALDPNWGGPYPVLYDDGPYTKGGHEPKGATANDHVWGVTAFVTPPVAAEDGGVADLQFSYGLVDVTPGYDQKNGWIWGDPNGAFTVPVGAKRDITAEGKMFPAFGQTDLMITLDMNQLHAPNDPSKPWDTSTVAIKGSASAWDVFPLQVDAATGRATFVQSAWVGPDTKAPHYGLFQNGAEPQWAWILGADEYKDAAGNAFIDGVKAYTKPQRATQWTEVAIERVPHGSGSNPFITVP
jgi:hypothetical protein